MTQVSESGISCGIVQVSDIQAPPRQVCQHIADAWINGGDYPEMNPAFLIWSDIDRADRGGIRLAQYILDNKLGDIQRSVSAKNPNTGNLICMWICKVNKEVWKTWLEKDK